VDEIDSTAGRPWSRTCARRCKQGQPSLALPRALAEGAFFHCLSSFQRRGRISPPPPPRTKWTRRVPHPVLIGHAMASLGGRERTRRTAGRNRFEPPPARGSGESLRRARRAVKFWSQRQPPLAKGAAPPRTNWTRLIFPPY